MSEDVMKPQTGSHTRQKRAFPLLAVRALVISSALLTTGLITKGAMADADGADAARGRALYAEHCVICHGARFEGSPGGPAIVGDTFRAKWASQSPEKLVDYLFTMMPPGAPGSLAPADYADLALMIRQANGLAPAAMASAPGPASSAPASSSAPDPHAAAAAAASARVNLVPAARARIDAREATLRKMRPVTDAMLRSPPEGDWLLWRRTYDAQGFSPLAQINRSNVSRIQAAWSWQLATGDNEITPLVHDGVMFVLSNGHLDALDAVSGEPLWQYVQPGASGIVRNIAIYEDRLFLAGGTSVAALDMRTGTKVWEKQIAAADTATKVSAGPVVVKGKVLQGMSFCTQASKDGCFIVALDAKTGNEIWRFKTIPGPNEPGGDTWNDTPAEQRAGASVWTTGSYDPALGLVYYGTGQTYQPTNLLRDTNRAPGLYTDTTLALDPDTGKLAWHYQHVEGDVWDLDWSFERVLADVTVNGTRRRTVTTGGKIGLFDTLDAATGKYLFSSDIGQQTLVSGIDPVTGAKTIDVDKVPTPGKTVSFCAGTLGGRNWPATSLNPRSQVLFVPFNDTCGKLQYPFIPPRDAFSADARDPDQLIGRVQAIDLRTRKTLWTRRERSPQASAILSTAGGLIFEGNRDRWFRASDDRTGKVLWQIRLNASVSSFPITYSVDGVQYVAVVAGGGNFFDQIIGSLTPEIVTTPRQPTLWIFRLPKQERNSR